MLRPAERASMSALVAPAAAWARPSRRSEDDVLQVVRLMLPARFPEGSITGTAAHV